MVLQSDQSSLQLFVILINNDAYEPQPIRSQIKAPISRSAMQVTNRTSIAYRKFNDGARVQIHRLRSRSFSFGRPFLDRSDPPQKIPIGKVPLPARIFCCNVIFFFDATKERIINPSGLYSSEFMAAIRAAFSGPKDELKRGRTERDTLIRE